MNGLSILERQLSVDKVLKESYDDNALILTQTYEWFKHFKKTDIS
jgi:hypothetical protein